MKDTHTLTRHADIQNWVSTRNGLPAIARVRDERGDIRSRLCLSFEKARIAPRSTPSQDDGMSPCSWTAWLAELDRQQLALKVGDAKKPAFEFVERRTMN
jgi:hypothetical protein